LKDQNQKSRSCWTFEAVEIVSNKDQKAELSRKFNK